jgi:hypothetical protein
MEFVAHHHTRYAPADLFTGTEVLPLAEPTTDMDQAKQDLMGL